jgi:hypothetical protein
LAEAVFQGLNGDVQADLVAKLEAVCHGLCGGIDAHSNAFNRMFFDAC